MGIFLIEIMMSTKLVLPGGQSFMPLRGDSKSAISAFLTNNRVTNDYPVRLKDSLLHPEYYRMYGPGNLIRSIASITCSSNHNTRLPISAIQIRIKQYKFNKHFLGCPKQAFQRQTIASAILQPAVALKFPKHSKIYDHQRPTSKEMMDEEIN